MISESSYERKIDQNKPILLVFWIRERHEILKGGHDEIK